MAAAGYQAEKSLAEAVKENDSKFVLVVEGAILVKDNGNFCRIGDRTALDLLKDVASHAGAIIAIGSCASPGRHPVCRPEPHRRLGGGRHREGQAPRHHPRLPELDTKLRPKFAYGRVIHDDCRRRAR
jgi:hydrogenase small subunit